MIESEALSRASPPHSDDAPHPTKRHRASRESESSNRESSSSQVFLPTIALDIDSETLRAMVKFIVSRVRSPTLAPNSFLIVLLPTSHLLKVYWLYRLLRVG